MKIDLNIPEHRKAYEYFNVTGHPFMIVDNSEPDDIDNQIHSIAAELIKTKYPNDNPPDDDWQNGSEWEAMPDISGNGFGIYCYWDDQEAKTNRQALIRVNSCDYELIYSNKKCCVKLDKSKFFLEAYE